MFNRIYFVTCIILCVIMLCIYITLNMKYKMQTLEQDTQELSKSIIAEQHNIHVLHAELSYLSSPNRIADLAKKHLDLRPIQVTQIKVMPNQQPNLLATNTH